jgi:outer membrane protein
MPKADKGRFIKLAIAAALAGAFAAPSQVRAQGLTLEAAMREALAKSEEVGMLKEKETRFKYRKREVLADALPQITANVNAGRGASPVDPSTFPFGGGGGPDTVGLNADQIEVLKRIGKASSFPTDVFNVAQNRFSYGVEATQPIFTFGKIGKAVKVAGIMEDADAFSRRRSEQQIELQVVDLFYGAVNSKARLASLEASARRYRETVGFLESNWKMGSGVKATVLRAITAQKMLEPQRITAERDAEASRMALNRIMGRDLDAPLDLDTAKLPVMEVPAALPDSQAVQSIIEDRPDIKALGLQKKSLEGTASIFRAGYLPAIAAQGKWGVTAFKLNQLGDIDKNQEWQIGVGARWNLFDGLRNSSQAQQYMSDARNVGLAQSQARKMSQLEIRSAFRDYRAADTALAAADQAVQAARQAQSMLSEDFRAGKGQITDLLESEEALRNAELGVLNARYQHVRAQAALRIALGKGLINEEVQ